jgi:hypothetical protein
MLIIQLDTSQFTFARSGWGNERDKFAVDSADQRKQAGAAEMGSCLTDATRGGRSGKPFVCCRYVAARTAYATIIAAC